MPGVTSIREATKVCLKGSQGSLGITSQYSLNQCQEYPSRLPRTPVSWWASIQQENWLVTKMVTPGIQRGNTKQPKPLASPKDAGTSGEAAVTSGRGTVQEERALASRGRAAGVPELGAGWGQGGSPWLWGKRPTASELPSRLKPCHLGTVGKHEGQSA